MLHDKGWPTQTSAYIISKAAMNAYARIVVKSYPSLLINWYLSWFCQNRYDFQHWSLYCRSGCQRPCYVGFASKGLVMLALLPKDLLASFLKRWRHQPFDHKSVTGMSWFSALCISYGCICKVIQLFLLLCWDNGVMDVKVLLYSVL